MHIVRLLTSYGELPIGIWLRFRTVSPPVLVPILAQNQLLSPLVSVNAGTGPFDMLQNHPHVAYVHPGCIGYGVALNKISNNSMHHMNGSSARLLHTPFERARQLQRISELGLASTS